MPGSRKGTNDVQINVRETENELKKIINFAKLNTFSYLILFNFIKSQIASLCQTPIHKCQYQFRAEGRQRTKMGVVGVRDGDVFSRQTVRTSWL